MRHNNTRRLVAWVATPLLVLLLLWTGAGGNPVDFLKIVAGVALLGPLVFLVGGGMALLMGGASVLDWITRRIR